MDIWESKLRIFAGKNWEDELKESLTEEFPPKKKKDEEDPEREISGGDAAPAPEGTKPGTSMKEPEDPAADPQAEEPEDASALL
jgi:hypothetical protein